MVEGSLREIRLGKWLVSPAWAPDEELEIDVEEIALVQVLGGRVQYLSQLSPIRAEETTILAPPQPYRMDARKSMRSATVPASVSSARR
jgi:hypothetical protein